MLNLLPFLIKAGKTLAGTAAAKTLVGPPQPLMSKLKGMATLGNLSQAAQFIGNQEARATERQSRPIAPVRQGSLQNLLRDYYG